jgi:hypothetical protein
MLSGPTADLSAAVSGQGVVLSEFGPFGIQRIDQREP